MTFWSLHPCALLPSFGIPKSTFPNPHLDGGGQEKESQSALFDCGGLSGWQQD